MDGEEGSIFRIAALHPAGSAGDLRIRAGRPMRVHARELELAREFMGSQQFEALNPEQLRLILSRGRELHRWFKTHLRLHAAISTSVIASILAADWFALIELPRFTISASVVVAAIVTGVVHSWLLYSLAIFSLHEGAAHHIIFPGAGPLSRSANYVSANLSRLAAAEPFYYSGCHMAHHARFGTEQDSEFLNFVIPDRFWRALLPLGTFLNYSDFVIHRPLNYTRGRLISGATAALYNGIYAYFLYRLFGGTFTAITLLLLPHVGFYTDRLRQFTEHNLMPLDNKSGARSLGVGFWGLLVGGGPWGQPCHLAHHLVPSIPWYQQILVHRYMVGLLTKRQRSQFLIRPLVGYPMLLWRVLREADVFSRAGDAASAGRSKAPEGI